jgi:hypothetical protein
VKGIGQGECERDEGERASDFEIFLFLSYLCRRWHALKLSIRVISTCALPPRKQPGGWERKNEDVIITVSLPIRFPFFFSCVCVSPFCLSVCVRVCVCVCVCMLENDDEMMTGLT